jgi:hypothetical protein
MLNAPRCSGELRSASPFAFLLITGRAHQRGHKKTS